MRSCNAGENGRTIADVIWLVGVPVKPDAARALIAMLLNDGSSDAMGGARAIAQAVRVGAGVVALTHEQRAAVARALEDAPAGLGELRGVLVREVRGRDGDA
jgi:hypothetical protein